MKNQVQPGKSLFHSKYLPSQSRAYVVQFGLSRLVFEVLEHGTLKWNHHGCQQLFSIQIKLQKLKTQFCLKHTFFPKHTIEKLHKVSVTCT